VKEPGVGEGGMRTAMTWSSWALAWADLLAGSAAGLSPWGAGLGFRVIFLFFLNKLRLKLLVRSCISSKVGLCSLLNESDKLLSA
jgi:hypothetical protein